MFQTGPSNPWLARAWANHAPYPHGSSIGQDLFQSGVIPSDTDFRFVLPPYFMVVSFRQTQVGLMAH